MLSASSYQATLNSYNTAKQDVTKYQEELYAVNPVLAANERKAVLQADLAAYVAQQQKDFENEEVVYSELSDALGLSTMTKKPLQEYAAELTAERDALLKENYELHKGIRVGRRRFLDADPQSGVTSVLGLRTTDDKIMLTFWICYIVFIVVACFFYMNLYAASFGLETFQQKIGIAVIITAFMYGVAYFAVVRFA